MSAAWWIPRRSRRSSWSRRGRKKGRTDSSLLSPFSLAHSPRVLPSHDHHAIGPFADLDGPDDVLVDDVHLRHLVGPAVRGVQDIAVGRQRHSPGTLAD